MTPSILLAALTLWYDHPAPQWDHGLPIGNGRLGAVVFGGVQRDRLQLNESSLWMGGDKDRDNPEALAHLAEVRRLLFAGQPREAAALAERKLMGRPNRLESYQTLGDLRLQFDQEGDVTDYRLELDLDTAIARVVPRSRRRTGTGSPTATSASCAWARRWTARSCGASSPRRSRRAGSSTSTRSFAGRWRPRAAACPSRRSAGTARSRNGRRTTRSRSRGIATSPSSSRSTRATRSRCVARPSWPGRRAPRWSGGSRTVEGTPDGAGPGSSTSGRGSKTASDGIHRLRPPAGQRVAAIRSVGHPVRFRPDGGVTLVDLAAGRSYEVVFRDMN